VWKFLFTEFDWTEFVTNVLALMFGLMTVVVIIYAAIFSEDKEMLAAVGSVTSGITGVILGFYFNRSRLNQAQNQANDAMDQLRDLGGEVEGNRDVRIQFEKLKRDYDNMSSVLENFISSAQPPEP
jgi:hypothetical protein